VAEAYSKEEVDKELIMHGAVPHWRIGIVTAGSRLRAEHGLCEGTKIFPINAVA
jgi:hypothetical protein